VRTMETLLDGTVAEPKLVTLLLGGFSALSLVLVGVGIYGVISYSVSRRTHEIGIRIALGARPGRVMALVLSDGAKLTLLGVGIGLAGALLTTRLLESLLFGVSATDPVTFAGVTLLVLVVALAACYVPAKRAMRVDPLVALRCE
jgi:putative ABC transport system permease protein